MFQILNNSILIKVYFFSRNFTDINYFGFTCSKLKSIALGVNVKFTFGTQVATG